MSTVNIFYYQYTGIIYTRYVVFKLLILNLIEAHRQVENFVRVSALHVSRMKDFGDISPTKHIHTK